MIEIYKTIDTLVDGFNQLLDGVVALGEVVDATIEAINGANVPKDTVRKLSVTHNKFVKSIRKVKRIKR